MLLALLNNTTFLSNRTVSMPGSQLMAAVHPYFIMPTFAFVACPNQDSVPCVWYGIEEAEMVRGMLRYKGFPEFVRALVEMGRLDGGEKEWLKEGIVWREVVRMLVGAEDSKGR